MPSNATRIVLSSAVKYPVQPLFTDEVGTVRFKSNPIVDWLLEVGGQDMNTIAMNPNFSKADRSNFAALIGYSLSGWGGLDYVTDQEYAAAEASLGEENFGEVKQLRARIAYLEETLETERQAVRELVEKVFPRSSDVESLTE